MNEHLLELIKDFPQITQRQIAKKLQISLGKVNQLIIDLEKDNMIVRKKHKKEQYQILEKGLRYMEKMYQEKYPQTAIILAAGISKNDTIPVSLSKIGDEIILERSIRLLLHRKIEHIVIICGYQAEQFQYLTEQYPQVEILFNPEYKTKGSFFSLQLGLKTYSKNILLLDGDILYEEKALDHILQFPSSNTILVSSEKGYRNESFVEEVNGKLYHLSKDIRELKNYQGEMLGISKFSKELSEAILKLEVHNPHFSYEYAIAECASQLPIEVLKIDRLLWADVSFPENFLHITNVLYPAIQKVENKKEKIHIKNILLEELKIKEEEIDFIEPLGGMTNYNFKVGINHNIYVLRNPGVGLGNLINRKNEYSNISAIQDLQLDADLFYFQEQKGIKITKYIENAETLNPTTAKQNLEKVAVILKKLHTSNIIFQNTFDVFQEIQKYESRIKSSIETQFPSYTETRKKVLQLEKELNEMGRNFVSCHNDTVAENFIVSQDRIYLIDWEYSGMNELEWDLAAFCLENNLSSEVSKKFLQIYFSGKENVNHYKKVLIYQICQDFLWSLWTILKEEHGDDFGDYGINRYTRCIKLLEVLEDEYKN